MTTKQPQIQTRRSSSNWESAVLVTGSISLGSFLLFLLITHLICVKVFKRRPIKCTRFWSNKKLKHPVQVQSDHEHARADDVESVEIVGNLDAEGMAFVDDTEANEAVLIPRDEELDSIIIDLSDISHVSDNGQSSGYSIDDFNFGDTFPFHSLQSLSFV